MSRFRLQVSQRRQLRKLLHGTPALNTYRRCLALLEVDAGRSVADVARSLGITRQSIHNWVARLDEAGRPEDLEDRYGGGRPALLGGEDVEYLVAMLGHPPQHLGCPATNWTVPLLCEHLGRSTGVRASEPTVRRLLHRLGYVWKRPRYVLEPDPERDKKTQDRPKAAGAARDDRHPGRG
jgi:transposase